MEAIHGSVGPRLYNSSPQTTDIYTLLGHRRSALTLIERVDRWVGWLVATLFQYRKPFDAQSHQAVLQRSVKRTLSRSCVYAVDVDITNMYRLVIHEGTGSRITIISPE